MPHLNSSIHPLDGFHRTLTTTVHLGDFPAHSECTLHLYYDLPSLVFFDPYELANHDEFFHFQKWGNSDLELPVTALDDVGDTGLQLLLNVRRGSLESLDVKLPLHMRYGDPQKGKDGYHSVVVEEPRGVLACPLESEHTTRRKTLLSISNSQTYPTEVASTLFSQSSESGIIFFDIPPFLASQHQHPELAFRVPVGNPSDLHIVELGTAITIVSCFVYLISVSWDVMKKLTSPNRPKVE